MNQTTITKLTSTNVDAVVQSIQFEEPQIDPTYGNVSIRMFIPGESDNKQSILLETPWMKAPFGLSKFEVAGGTVPKFKLPLSFDNLDTCPRQQVFKKFCELLDERIVNAAHENAGSWLKKDGQPRAVVKAFYSPLLTYSKDKKGKINDQYPPKVQLKLGTYNNDDGTYRFAAPVYKDKNTKVDDPSVSIVKGTQAKSIVEFTTIWEVSGKFGASWRSNVIKIKERQTQSAYQFQNDSDDDDDDDESKTAGVDDFIAELDIVPSPIEEADADADADDTDVVEKKKPARRGGGRKKKDAV